LGTIRNLIKKDKNDESSNNSQKLMALKEHKNRSREGQIKDDAN
jgi:hypothetical protein